MGAPVSERTPHLPQVSVALLEPETEERVVVLKGHHLTPEVKAKISKTRKERGLAKGEKNPFFGVRFSGEDHYLFGKHLTEETREKLRTAALNRPIHPALKANWITGRPGYWRGKHLPDETKQKISLSRTGKGAGPDNPQFGRHQSEETLRKLSQARKGLLCGERNGRWNGGSSFEPYCPRFSKEFKERVRAFWEYRCGLCGKTQVENGRALSVHHVHYLKEACCDEMIKPLFVPLCMTCHSKTNSGDRNEWEAHFTQVITEKHGGQCYLSKPMEGVR
jgi:5-methylcytosine-specific restriction endonuclease McrA